MEGVIRVPLAPVRSDPSDRAEMVTQALFGERVDMEPVEGQSNWAKVHLHLDGYQGFIDPKLVDTSEEAVEAFESDCLQLTVPSGHLSGSVTMTRNRSISRSIRPVGFR